MSGTLADWVMVLTAIETGMRVQILYRGKSCEALGRASHHELSLTNQFQSHEPEFDYLKSLEIEEKINRIKWCKRQNAAHFLLSTNGTSR